MTIKFYEVGGSIRDELLGFKSKDKDYCVEAPSYEDMRDEVIRRGGIIYLEKPEYLTIRAKVLPFGDCDFVLCRKDGSYYDGRHPDSVEPGTILDDLRRRDFTVNAIAKDENGNLIDPHNGLQDINDRLLRCVGVAKDRFEEDRLRVIRAIRFSITKKLTIHGSIDSCLYLNPELLDLKGISVDRLRVELLKCFEFDTARTLQELRFYNLLTIFDNNPLWLKPTMEW